MALQTPCPTWFVSIPPRSLSLAPATGGCLPGPWSRTSGRRRCSPPERPLSGPRTVGTTFRLPPP
eukprot:10515924-Ditylum_brightwellii.AAC.1